MQAKNHPLARAMVEKLINGTPLFKVLIFKDKAGQRLREINDIARISIQ